MVTYRINFEYKYYDLRGLLVCARPAPIIKETKELLKIWEAPESEQIFMLKKYHMFPEEIYNFKMISVEELPRLTTEWS